jgi:hypothetical protein
MEPEGSLPCSQVPILYYIVGPHHHSMTCPQVEDGRDGLQIWIAAVNILNKQLQTANKGWSSSLGKGLTLLTIKKVCYEMLHRAFLLQTELTTFWISEHNVSCPILIHTNLDSLWLKFL